MPAKTKKRYKRRPRRYGRYRKRGYKKPMLSLRSPIANKAVIKMRYADHSYATPSGSGAVSSIRWRANGIYDPLVDGGGHQPLGHDQWALFYTRYVVLGSKITATFTTLGTTEDTSNVIVGISLLHDTTTITDVNQIREQGNAVWKPMTLQKDCVTLTKNFSAKRFFGVKDVTSEDTVAALFGADPADGAIFHTWMAAAPSSAETPGTVVVSVIIEYLVMLREVNNLPQS